MDGPIFVKSGVTLLGKPGNSGVYPIFTSYDGPNIGNAAEDALIVLDGVTDAEVSVGVSTWFCVCATTIELCVVCGCRGSQGNSEYKDSGKVLLVRRMWQAFRESDCLVYYGPL